MSWEGLHERRRTWAKDALSTVRADPGITGRSVAARIGATPTDAGWILWHLAEMGQVRCIPTKKAFHYVPADITVKEWKERHEIMRTPHLVALLSWIKDNPDRRQLDIIDYAAATWNWPRSSTRERLTSLVRKGILERGPQRQATYKLRPNLWIPDPEGT
jgi:hypothetical protein